MRKVMFAALVMLLGLSLTTASFAATAETAKASTKKASSTVIRGTITAIDAAAKQISVQADGSKEVTKVTVADVASLKEGARVKITLKAGTTDQAESVKVLSHKKKK